MKSASPRMRFAAVWSSRLSTRSRMRFVRAMPWYAVVQGMDSSSWVDSSEKWAIRWYTSARPVAPPPFMVLSERISWRRT